MAGVDRRTGKVIGQADHIRQSIEVILTTPTGSRVMRRTFGFPGLDAQGRPLPIAAGEFAELAIAALQQHEPRIDQVRAFHEGEAPVRELLIRYIDRASGEPGSVTVRFAD